VPGQSFFVGAPRHGAKHAKMRGSSERMQVSSVFRSEWRGGCCAFVVVYGALVSVVTTGCAARAAAPPVAAPRSTAPTHLAVSRTVVTPRDVTSVEEIYTEARAAYDAGRFADAARGFDRITELDPDGPRAKEAWFNGGAAHDQLGDFEGAASRYRETARRYPGDPLSRESLVRGVRLLAYLEHWQGTGEAADALLLHLQELTPVERVVAYGGKALSLVVTDDPDRAEYFISKGRDVVDAARLDAAGAVPRDLAELYFALGELRRLRGERIHLAPPPPDFVAALEKRCQLLLDAQSAYSDTMRAYDAHWSAMAGFRVGELYQKLHEEVMQIPPPAAATTKAKAELFEGAMRLRYSVLLEKGLTMMEHTVQMAARAGEHSEWVVRATEAKGRLEQAVRDETAALDRLPYTREDLEKALADLTHRKQRRP
jgi:tetratricopeptide (TPR) repeat protein